MPSSCVRRIFQILHARELFPRKCLENLSDELLGRDVPLRDIIALA